MTTTATMTYRVGSIDTHGHHARMTYPRPLLDSEGRTVAIVDCEPGGLSDLTADDVYARFGVDVRPRDWYVRWDSGDLADGPFATESEAESHLRDVGMAGDVYSRLRR